MLTKNSSSPKMNPELKDPVVNKLVKQFSYICINKYLRQPHASIYNLHALRISYVCTCVCFGYEKCSKL